jgi:hypothetical protein
MDRYIAEQNIEHYKRLLATEVNDEKRQTVLHLLANEEATLRLIEEKRKHGHAFQPKT